MNAIIKTLKKSRYKERIATHEKGLQAVSVKLKHREHSQLVFPVKWRF